jgi:hypothetical protein
MKSLNLRGLSEDDITNIFQEIITKPGPLTKIDLEDIATLGGELIRRSARQGIRVVGGAAFKGIELIS